MRVPLPQLKTNGHAAPPGRVFAITGLCQEPSFRVALHASDPEDFCFIDLGAPVLGAPAHADTAAGGRESDPHFVLRRRFEAGAVMVALRVELEGVFTLLANDEERAEAVFREQIAPSAPEEVQRAWSDEPETLSLFADLLRLR